MRFDAHVTDSAGRRTPGVAPPAAWLRYAGAHAAAFLDDESRQQFLAHGWALVVADPVARSALARLLAEAHGRLAVLDDTWAVLRPHKLGAALGEAVVATSRAAYTDLLGPPDETFDPLCEFGPLPTVGSLRVAGAVAAALAYGPDRLPPHEPTPSGVPRRLTILRHTIDRWANTRSIARRQTGGAAVLPFERRSSAACGATVEKVWQTRWEFDPDDLSRALCILWARIAMYDPDLDWLTEVSDVALLAWCLAALSV